ncbi:hypothetical protein SCLARK_001130 [Spiroplasma clarkii]|uniref:hypothetical protein n=1 Tax=Spiroplasma clarkii TaxID=2139 RepID=UPI000B5534DC|nr:hypothetical protein [Spiroplasma clarkii]ARU91693.1 hypothetical protein SCLARK_001130 [Spiroplasma clarkii]
MISVYERVENLALDSKNTTFTTIAKQILSDFNEGIFRNQNELSDICFVSMSTVTQFSKATLCEGYKELTIRLKIEYENRMLVKPIRDAENVDELSLQVLEIINAWAIDAKEFILSLAKEINQKKRIWIAPSSQSLPATRNLHDILLNQGVDVKLMDSSTNLEVARHFDFKNELVLMVVTGRDTLTLQRILEYLEKLSRKVYIITTLNHAEEIPVVDGWNILYLNLNKYTDYKYKLHALNTLYFYWVKKLITNQ